MRKRPQQRHERAQIILMVGLATIVMFGIVGLAVDVGRLYVTRVELGRSLDSAALSGILELNGQSSGLGYAEDKAEGYFMDNESVSSCDGSQGVTCNAWANPDANELTMDATKTIRMFFLSVLGIKTASVSAHAKAGFGTQYVDAVMVLDATPSMNGSPLANAKDAAIAFKNILLGSNPQGNVLIGVTPFRGCFNPPRGQSDCIGTSQISGLSFDSDDVEDTIDSITASGANSSATNVCTGLAKGWEILSGTVAGEDPHDNETEYPGFRRYMILLSDGDNAYWGSIAYQNDGTDNIGAIAPFSPTGVNIGGTDYPCMPIDATSGSDGTACPSPWNSLSINSTYPCYKGVFSPTSITEGFDSYGTGTGGTWNGGSGWASGSSWTQVGTPNVVNSPTESGSRAMELNSTDSIARAFDLTGIGSALLTFEARHRDMDSSDRVYVEVNDGGGWDIVATLQTGGGGLRTSYDGEQVSLDDYIGLTNVQVRWRASMGASDFFYVDTIGIDGDGDSEGFLNGTDGSHPQTCEEYPRPRERQVDVRTMELARAIKAQGIEIFVVAFAGGVDGCNLNNTQVFDDETPSHCNTVLDSTPGPIGDDTYDGTGNHRLLKCISSNSQGRNDHYYFANDEDELTGIFTQIANQIAHRLLE